MCANQKLCASQDCACVCLHAFKRISLAQVFPDQSVSTELAFQESSLLTWFIRLNERLIKYFPCQ